MNAVSERGIFFYQLQLSKFHCLVYEKLCQTVPGVKADTQVQNRNIAFSKKLLTKVW